METLPPTRFSFDEFEIDSQRRVLFKQGQMVALNPKTFDLLMVLVERHGEVLSKNDLLDAVWEDQFVEEKNLTVHISALRKLFGERKDENRFIATIPGTGYKFVAAVKTDAESEIVIEHERVELISIHEETVEDPNESALAGKRSGFRMYAIYAAALAGLGLIGVYVWSAWNKPVSGVENAQTVQSIAVLPFQFLNGQTQNDGLELGLTESLINRLSALKTVSIRPVTAVRKYTLDDRDLERISNELKVDSVLEGHIQKEGSRLRLTIRLLNTKSGVSIWNEQIDESYSDMFEVQDKISRRVAASLEIALSEHEKRQFAKVYTQSGDAYKKYLIGRYNWNKRNPDGFYESIKFYNQAIGLDPTFALAYAGLADSYLLIGLYSAEPTTDAFPKARAAAEKALEIDKDLGEAEVDLAMIANLFQYDWQIAEKHFSRAVDLRPSYSTGHHWFGLFLAMQGRTEEALEHIRKAKDLDPLSASISTDLAFAYYLAGQNDLAIEQLEKTLKLDPDFPNAHNVLGMSYLSSKRNEEALAEFEKADKLSAGNIGRVEKIWANGFMGNADKARQLLAEMPAEKKMSPFDLAIVYTSLGETDRAVNYLNAAYEKRDPQIVPIKVFPPLESLRPHPGFKELLRKMGL